ncbi:hypothetical protein [Xanthomonas medicagonis]|uniref:hypothetical protein n=1 Tax=Xanthomonas medicagonis TaxID=3160841 RepID=UPI003516F706
MIEWWVGPRSRKEVSFAFDASAAGSFLAMLRDARANGSSGSIEAMRVRHGEGSASSIEVERVRDEAEECIVLKRGVRLRLADDALDYAIFKLAAFVEEGCFSPAEYCALPSPDRGDVQVYFVGQGEGASI